MIASGSWNETTRESRAVQHSGFAGFLSGSARLSDRVIVGGVVALLGDDKVSDASQRGLGFGVGGHIDMALLTFDRSLIDLRLDVAHTRATYDFKRGVGFDNVQIGSGNTSLDSTGVGATFRYDYAYTDTTVVGPYLGVYYEHIHRGAYTEGENMDTAVSFDALTENAVVARVGLRGAHEWLNGFILRGGVGADIDLHVDDAKVTGTSVLMSATTFTFDTDQDRNNVRGNALLILEYALSERQRVEWGSRVETPSFADDWAALTGIRYSLLF